MDALFRHNIQLHWGALVYDLTNTEIVCKCLQDQDILRSTEHRRQSSKHLCRVDDNETLLQILLETDQEKKPLRHFVTTLQITQQWRLVALVTCGTDNHIFLSEDHRSILQNNWVEIVQVMVTSDALAAMYYLTEEHVDKLRLFQSPTAKAEYLLKEVIIKGTYRYLHGLKQALVDTNLHEVLKSYLPVNVTTSSSHDYLLPGDTFQIYVRLRCVDMNVFEVISNLVRELMAEVEQLHAQMSSEYHIKQIVAVPTTSEIIQMTIKLKDWTKVISILDHVDNGYLQNMMKRYSCLTTIYSHKNIDLNIFTNHSSEAELFYKSPHQDYIELALCSKNTDASLLKGTDFKSYARTSPNKGKVRKEDVPKAIFASARFSVENKTSKIVKYTENPEAIAVAAYKPSTSQGLPSVTADMKRAVMEAINGKEHTQYDFWRILVSCRQGSISPLQLKTDDGLNLLHFILEKGRISFLPQLVLIGWWTILSLDQIPNTSLNEYRGKTPKQLAEFKRAKKPLSEFILNADWDESLSPLMKACRSGDLSRVQQIMQYGDESMYYCDSNGGNALFWAVVLGNVSVFKKLLNLGVDPSVRTKKNENLLHVSVAVGHSHMLEPLLNDTLGLDTKLSDTGHKTPLERNSENGDIDSLKEFIKFGLLPEASCAVLSAFVGRMEYLQYLLEHLKLSINSTDLYSRTALHRACEGSKTHIVNYLVERGADISMVTCTGRNLLHIAAEAGNDFLMGKLMHLFSTHAILQSTISSQDKYNGVELCFLIRGRDKGRDAWHYVEVKRILVPVFLKKTRSGNVDVAQFGLVLQSGWGVNPDQDAMEEIETEFKRRRLDVNAASDMTPLHIALFKGHRGIAKMLLDKGCSVNVKDKFGNTPLMIAAAKGQRDIMQIMEEKGANYKDENTDGQSVLDIAKLNEQEDIVNYIEGRDYQQITRTFCQCQVSDLESKLSRPQLDRLRRQKIDVKRHIIDSLRDFKIEINQILRDIGSGPILEATDEDRAVASQNTATFSHHMSEQGNRTWTGQSSVHGYGSSTVTRLLEGHTEERSNPVLPYRPITSDSGVFSSHDSRSPASSGIGSSIRPSMDRDSSHDSAYLSRDGVVSLQTLPRNRMSSPRNTTAQYVGDNGGVGDNRRLHDGSEIRGTSQQNSGNR